ncbi:hypothetical protein [Thalassospira australica]|uniref:hypothetical protein n=1 Tax=Thalassospira australica TaxID=1528106 RepID=UPI003850E90D
MIDALHDIKSRTGQSFQKNTPHHDICAQVAVNFADTLAPVIDLTHLQNIATALHCDCRSTHVWQSGMEKAEQIL